MQNITIISYRVTMAPSFFALSTAYANQMHFGAIVLHVKDIKIKGNLLRLHSSSVNKAQPKP